jgi:glycosyltransferase involved in cell wall biosynthesis
MGYKKNGWSILIPAYNAAEWIEETLNSVQNQTYFKDNDDYEIILGIDGCQKTLDKVNEIKDKYKNLRVYFLRENRGCYVTLNTILQKTLYDKSITVGADDMMMPSLIEKINPFMKDNDVVMYYMQNSYPDGRQELSLKEVEGVAAVCWNVWEELGGYWEHRVAGDSDFELRLKKTNFNVHILRKPLYLRRIHPNSLTQSEETGYMSPMRKKIAQKLADKQYRRPVKSNNYDII